MGSHFKCFKMERAKILGLLATSLVLSVLFNNCTQNGELVVIPASNNILATDDLVLVNIEACNEAAAAGQLQTINQKVSFEDSRIETGLQNICSFPAQEDALGNLSMKDGQMRARYEQSKSLQLPANAVVCDIKLSNDLQSFRYDDVFFLIFNNYVLATNNKTALKQRLSPTSINSLQSNVRYNLYNYNWMSLRTAAFENVVDDFCLGSEAGLGSCSWPVTESAGKILLSWSPEVFIRLTAAVAQNQTFKFVITGDNDPSLDCYHQKLEFDTTVKYILK
ncbi:MAG: hypothetical protein AABY64_09400 [Bdellovibrionota bacterium]